MQERVARGEQVEVGTATTEETQQLFGDRRHASGYGEMVQWRSVVANGLWKQYCDYKQGSPALP